MVTYCSPYHQSLKLQHPTTYPSLQGVGSHASHLLLRSGIGKLRLVDFDQVTLSSLNRHCLATRSDVGIPKATCLANHFKHILPEADLEAMVAMYDDSTEEQILGEGSFGGERRKPDFVLDAIDNIDTKVALLAACQRRGIKVLSSAGAGAKADPTRIKIVDMMESSLDPLARSVRYRLRKDYGIETGIPVLLSTEKPRCGLIFVPGEDAGANPLDYQVVPNFRIRTIPVLGTVPAIFGLAAASYILCELAQAPFHPEPMFRLQAKAIQTQYDRLETRESDRFGSTDGVQVDIQEVEVLLRELWKGVSARATGPPASDKGLGRQLGDLVLTRWDPLKNATIDNLVLLRKEEADAHDALVEVEGGLERLKKEEPEFCRRVEAVLQRAKEQFKYGYY